MPPTPNSVLELLVSGQWSLFGPETRAPHSHASMPFKAVPVLFVLLLNLSYNDSRTLFILWLHSSLYVCGSDRPSYSSKWAPFPFWPFKLQSTRKELRSSMKSVPSLQTHLIPFYTPMGSFWATAFISARSPNSLILRPPHWSGLLNELASVKLR